MDIRTNPLTMAPHTQARVISNDWNRPYTREQAAFPAVSILYQIMKIHFLCEILGYGGKDADGGLPGCDPMRTCR